jgi:predicted transglutaminase-like cysteine proteinase
MTYRPRLAPIRSAAAALALAAAAFVAPADAAAQNVQVAYAPEPAVQTGEAAPRLIGGPEQLSRWHRLGPYLASRDLPAAGGTVTRDLLVQVNAEANARPYRADSALWGASDFWALPEEFARYGGDCEDYAIAKYVALRERGVPADDLRIAVGYDHQRGDYHAVLKVRAEGRWLVLDMEIDQPLEPAQIAHFQTIYTIGEAGLWDHRRQVASN